MAWHGATVPVVAVRLSWCWFTNCLARYGLVVAFVIVFYSLGGIVALGLLVALPGHGVVDLDPGLLGQGPRWPGLSCGVKAGVVRPIL